MKRGSRLGPMQMWLQTYGLFFSWLYDAVVQAVIEVGRAEHFAHNSVYETTRHDGRRVVMCTCGHTIRDVE